MFLFYYSFSHFLSAFLTAAAGCSFSTFASCLPSAFPSVLLCAFSSVLPRVFSSVFFLFPIQVSSSHGPIHRNTLFFHSLKNCSLLKRSRRLDVLSICPPSAANLISYTC